MTKLQVGEKVTAIYKTGKYIGEITEIRPQHYLVKVLAVLKHPMQGDLHNPKDANVLFFHERRALSYREKANVPQQMVKQFANQIPEYQASLNEAIEKMKKELTDDSSEWALRSLKNIETLEKDYFK